MKLSMFALGMRWGRLLCTLVFDMCFSDVCNRTEWGSSCADSAACTVLQADVCYVLLL